jgi:hypothetical protein
MKFDNIEQLIEEINRKDFEMVQNIRKREMLLIEERFKKWEKGISWDDFVRMVESDADNDEEVAEKDFTPIIMMCKFIENGGDPLIYLKAISLSHPGHPFCQMLIECETVRQFLNRLKPLEAKVPILFRHKGKKWLSELFEVSKGFVREEYESEIRNSVDTVEACVEI